MVEPANDFLSLVSDKVLPEVHGRYDDVELALHNPSNVGVDGGTDYVREGTTSKDDRIMVVGGVISGENFDLPGIQNYEPTRSEVWCTADIGVDEMIDGPIKENMVEANLLNGTVIRKEVGPITPKSGNHMLTGQGEICASPSQNHEVCIGSPCLQQRREENGINLSRSRQSRVSVRTIKPISHTRTDMEFYPYVSKRKGKRAKRVGVDDMPNLMPAAATFDDEGMSMRNEEQNSEVEGVWDIGSQVAIKFQDGRSLVVEKIAKLGVSVVNPNEVA